jgi:predicted enzyme related to lactoylglutathione lyase
MRKNLGVAYIELPGQDMGAMKAFYSGAFGWRFTDYGPDYAAFDEGLDGGFATDADERPKAPLVILWAEDLEAALAAVEKAGAAIVRPIFAYPGGRRFHFRDPAGNELAIYTDA